MYLFSCVLLILRVQAPQHFVLIQLPQWIHTCRKGFSALKSRSTKISLFLCGPPSLLSSLQARLSWSQMKQFPCMKVSAGERCGNPLQHSFMMLLSLRSTCLSSASIPAQLLDRWSQQPSVSRPRRCTQTHTRIHTESSVTVQNPCLGYLETGVEFLIHISEGIIIEPEVLWKVVLEGQYWKVV